LIRRMSPCSGFTQPEKGIKDGPGPTLVYRNTLAMRMGSVIDFPSPDSQRAKTTWDN